MDNKIWSYLMHLGYNMWSEPYIQDGYYEGAPQIRSSRITHTSKYNYAEPFLRCDMKLCRELAVKAKEYGVNMFVIDIGDAIKYESHPEISCKGALTKSELEIELDYLRKLGIEPIPKLNFSACHDMWLGPYSKMLCTPIYYKVCADLINEVCELFSTPRFFHIGMDEEKASDQVNLNLIIERQGDLWWHDFYYFVKNVERCGVRAWAWSDYMWFFEDLFFKNMPKEVVQSNWYYYEEFETDKLAPDRVEKLKAFSKLAESGYEQIPSGSNWASPENFSKLAEYINENIDQKKILGFMQTVWRPILPETADIHYQALEQFNKK